ncbi:MAG: peptidase family protein [Phycisphaerales bacterium]|nr:peptidase family protein [Phycisphaerales bacterium]
MPHALYIPFLFAFGACIGSFLNVVVWRLPRDESLVSPPSHCPKCNKLLKWYDNIPVLGWIKLGGRCRYCKESISARYPIIEAITGLLFVLFYVMYFMVHAGPCVGVRIDGLEAHAYGMPTSIAEDWPIYFLDMLLLSGLLASSLIDAELFIIPIEIPWLIAAIAIFVHTVLDQRMMPGNLIVGPRPAALAAGAGLGTLISFLLWVTGKLPMSFAEGGPMLEIERDELEQKRTTQEKTANGGGKKASKTKSAATEETEPEPREWTSREVRKEMRKEMLFLLPALGLGILWVVLVWKVPAIGRAWESAVRERWVGALLGSVLGGLVGGFTVWLTRILGTLVFGREAMGMGDVHLMVGVGAVIGGGGAVLAFFLAPFFGIALAIYMLLTGKKRELPYGPYLSLATAFVMLFYCPIAEQLAPGLSNAAWILGRLLNGEGGA